MKQMFRLLLVSLLSGLWFSTEDALCENTDRDGNTMSYCYSTTSRKTCFTTFLANNNHPRRISFEGASRKCKSSVPGSSLIVINSLESQRIVELFIGRQLLRNETIFTDARKLSPGNDQNWSWVNPKVPNDARPKRQPINDAACVKRDNKTQLAYCYGSVSSKFRYICEYSDSKSELSFRQSNRSYVANVNSSTWFDARKECIRLGGDLAFITDLNTLENWSQLEANLKYWIGLYRDKWIWNSTGAAVSYTNWERGYPDESSDKHCVCIGENSIPSFDRKWRACNCNHSYAVVCQKEEKSVSLITQVAATEDFQSSAYFPIHNSTDSYGSSHSPLSSSPSPSPTPSPSTPSPSTTTTITTTQTKAFKTNSTKTALTKVTTPQSNDSKSHTTSKNKTTPANSTISTAGYIRSTTPIDNPPDTTADGKAVSTLSVTQTLENQFPEKQTAAFEQPAGLFNPLKTEGIILILLLFVTIAFIVAAVIVVIRKRRYDRRNEESSTKNTNQDATVSSEYASVVPVNRPPEGATTPPGNTIYSDVEMTQQPTPSDNTIYASVKPIGDAIDLGKSVDYADLDFPRKSEHKPRSADKITACLSPIYAQPFEPSTSANITEYAEPFKPDKTHSATAPVINHSNAAGDQQNIYSFAKEIPSGYPNVIYSEPIKAGRSSVPMGKEASMADNAIYQEAIEVKRGAGIGGDATQDTSVVYFEPIRPKSHNKS